MGNPTQIKFTQPQQPSPKRQIHRPKSHPTWVEKSLPVSVLVICFMEAAGRRQGSRQHGGALVDEGEPVLGGGLLAGDRGAAQ